MEIYEKWMKEALLEAKKAEALNEVPIGAVIVYQNQIIGKGYNLRETSKDPSAHAEMIAIREACQSLQAWRLLDCQLYVTLEPCPMCAGAIVQARIPQLIFGAYDPKAGCAGSICNLLQEKRFNHQVNIVSQVLQDDCSMMLSLFFKKIRNRNL
jgi:tRNA(adenine34) deaminase